ncbi:hypothetical protein K0M31_016971 [Melipona bicolor]|uniref:Uncharacterized protein n=1 Tax=Melipona bicolor TaxID=60889 RepID=A0AA40KEE3_9HYME|nr:hypothetical protein K0M31_016971 [Melipona bicolor]
MLNVTAGSAAKDTQRPRTAAGYRERRRGGSQAAGGDARKDTPADPDYKRLAPRWTTMSCRERTSSGAATTGRDSEQDDLPGRWGRTDPLRESSAARYLIPARPRDSSRFRASLRDVNPAANLISLISTSRTRGFPRAVIDRCFDSSLG